MIWPQDFFYNYLIHEFELTGKQITSTMIFCPNWEINKKNGIMIFFLPKLSIHFLRNSYFNEPIHSLTKVVFSQKLCRFFISWFYSEWWVQFKLITSDMLKNVLCTHIHNIFNTKFVKTLKINPFFQVEKQKYFRH